MFKNGGATLGTVATAGGVATLAVSTLSAGTHSITAVYKGVAGVAGSTSAALGQVVSAATSSVTVSSSLNPSAAGQAVTFTAAVSSESGSIPTGNISFLDGAKNLGSGAISAGVATVMVSSLSAGTHSITAVYKGTSAVAGSTSAAVSQVVGASTSSVALASSLNPSAFGQPVTFTATVNTSAGSAPTGSVVFKNGTATLGTVALVGGAATLAVNSLNAGTHTITAVYRGTASVSGSTSPALSQVVSASTSSTTVASSVNPSAFGQPIIFTATVSSQFGGAATGNVVLKNGSATLGTVALVGGAATLSVSNLSAGTHSITAVYRGTSAVAGSTSPALSQLVGVSASSVTIASSLNPSAFGQPVTFNASVSSQSGSTVTGNVAFLDGGTSLGSAALVNGVSTFTLSTLSPGTHAISAAYAGVSGIAAGTSAPLSQVVSSTATATNLASSLNPASFGQSVTFTATVSASSGTPTGSVSFTNGGAAVGSAVLVGGVAQFTTSSLPPGTLNITASYVPSAGFGASSTSLIQTVNQNSSPGYLVAAAALSGPVIAGNSATSTVTVTPVTGYTGTVNLSCTVMGSGVPAPTCAFNPTSVTISGSSAITSSLGISTAANTPIGNYSILIAASDANAAAPLNGSQMLTVSILPVIQHVIIIFQENRTPDNLFHDPVLIARGADIASSGVNSNGQVIPLTSIDLGTAGSNPQFYDVNHNHNSFVAMYDDGKMDGADHITCNPFGGTCPDNPQFKYVDPADVQPYFDLAEQYTFGDRMFQTNQGESYPAHQFIISGTSAPTATSPLFASGGPTNNDAGCIAPPGTLVPMINALGQQNIPKQYPCFEHPTLTDLLDQQFLTWHYYAPLAGSIWTGPNSIEHICQEQSIDGVLTCESPEWRQNVIFPSAQALKDINNGQLSTVTWVIPDGSFSDHPHANNGSGPSWVSSIVNAVGNSPYWANTVIFITWDDWGGWYDHVPPTVIKDGFSWGSGYVYGFRVPLIVVSPYAKHAYISHVTHDFGSILKFIETNFNLPSLGYADARADDFSDCFDFTQSPVPFQTIRSALQGNHFILDKTPPTPPDDY